jgi:hypothetical protein
MIFALSQFLRGLSDSRLLIFARRGSPHGDADRITQNSARVKPSVLNLIAILLVESDERKS